MRRESRDSFDNFQHSSNTHSGTSQPLFINSQLRPFMEKEVHISVHSKRIDQVAEAALTV